VSFLFNPVLQLYALLFSRDVVLLGPVLRLLGYRVRAMLCYASNKGKPRRGRSLVDQIGQRQGQDREGHKHLLSNLWVEKRRGTWTLETCRRVTEPRLGTCIGRAELAIHLHP
jgi:hypothetical protein